MTIGSIFQPQIASITQLIKKVFPVHKSPTDELKLVATFAYGSGLINQGDKVSTHSNSQLDLIFIVNNTKAWHEMNMKKNPDHYAKQIQMMNAECLFNKLFRYLPRASIFYHTLIPIQPEFKIPNTHFKYGVIEVKKAIDDLNNWKYLYLAGRLQKPVVWIQKPIDGELEEALRNNLVSALIFVLLKPKYNEKSAEYPIQEVFYDIASISYSGDFRVHLGEGSSKIKRIVSDERMPNFLSLYRVAINDQRLKNLITFSSDGQRFLIKPISDEGLIELFLNLPCSIIAADERERMVTEFIQKKINRRQLYEAVQVSTERIVSNSSRHQTLLALVTTQPAKIIKYSLAKITKILSS